MSSPEKQFKINLNQYLWGLVVGLSGLGLAEYFYLNTLFWFAVVLSAVMVLSVAATTLAYTINYWRGKLEHTSSASSPWFAHIAGCHRLGIITSGLWIVLAVAVYFLGICLYPSPFTSVLTKLYTWRQMTAEQFLDAPGVARPASAPTSFIPDYPALHGCRFLSSATCWPRPATFSISKKA